MSVRTTRNGIEPSIARRLGVDIGALAPVRAKSVSSSATHQIQVGVPVPMPSVVGAIFRSFAWLSLHPGRAGFW